MVVTDPLPLFGMAADAIEKERSGGQIGHVLISRSASLFVGLRRLLPHNGDVPEQLFSFDAFIVAISVGHAPNVDPVGHIMTPLLK